MKIALTLILGVILTLLLVFVLAAGLDLMRTGPAGAIIVGLLMAGAWISGKIDPIP